MTTATLTPAAAAKVESATTNATAMLHDLMETFGELSPDECRVTLKTDAETFVESFTNIFPDDPEIGVRAKTQIAIWALEACAGGHTANTCRIAFLPYNEHGRLCLYCEMLPLTPEELQERRERQD